MKITLIIITFLLVFFWIIPAQAYSGFQGQPIPALQDQLLPPLATQIVEDIPIPTFEEGPKAPIVEGIETVPDENNEIPELKDFAPEEGHESDYVR